MSGYLQRFQARAGLMGVPVSGHLVAPAPTAPQSSPLAAFDQRLHQDGLADLLGDPFEQPVTPERIEPAVVPDRPAPHERTPRAVPIAEPPIAGPAAEGPTDLVIDDPAVGETVEAASVTTAETSPPREAFPEPDFGIEPGDFELRGPTSEQKGELTKPDPAESGYRRSLETVEAAMEDPVARLVDGPVEASPLQQPSPAIEVPAEPTEHRDVRTADPAAPIEQALGADAAATVADPDPITEPLASLAEPAMPTPLPPEEVDEERTPVAAPIVIDQLVIDVTPPAANGSGRNRYAPPHSAAQASMIGPLPAMRRPTSLFGTRLR